MHAKISKKKKSRCCYCFPPDANLPCLSYEDEMKAHIKWILFMMSVYFQQDLAHSSGDATECFFKYTGSKGVPWPTINLPSESEIFFRSILKLTFNVSNNFGNQQPIPVGIAAVLLIDKRHDDTCNELQDGSDSLLPLGCKLMDLICPKALSCRVRGWVSRLFNCLFQRGLYQPYSSHAGGESRRAAGTRKRLSSYSSTLPDYSVSIP